jgi:pimeloyl-ACP methyl ester carboxylesterase
VVLVGHSFGGRVAIRLAARHPDRVAALVLTGVPFVPRSGAKKPALAYRLARLAHRVGIVSENKMESLRQRYGSLDYRNAEGVMRQVLVAAIGEDYFEDAARISQPVTMVWGENDQPAPLAGAQQALEHFSNATVRVVPGAGHLLEGTLEAELRDALAHALPD